MVLLLLALGLVGAYFGVRGQDPRLPWPPPPVTPTNFVETNPPTKAKSTTALPPAPAPKPAAEPAPAPPMPPPLPRSETPASAAPEKALTPVRYETAIPTLPARTPDKHSSPPAPAPPIIESPKAESGAGNPSAFTIPQIPTAPPIPTLDQLNNIAVAAPDPAPARIPDMQKPLETKGRDPVIIEASATAPKPSVQPGAPPAIVS